MTTPTQVANATQELIDSGYEIALYGAALVADIAIDRGDYDKAMPLMVALGDEIEVFLDKVHINTDNEKLKKRRVFLLKRARDTLAKFADWGKLEVGK